MKSYLIILLLTATMATAESDLSAWLREQKIENATTLTLPKGVHHARPDDFPFRFLLTSVSGFPVMGLSLLLLSP